VLRATPALAAKVRHNSDLLAAACAVDPVAGAVLSVVMPGPDEALAAVAEAARHGIRIGCFRPPSTPDGTSRLRLTAHAHHEDLTAACDLLAELTRG
jgi:8-amino-7-oxononanoate synthase